MTLLNAIVCLPYAPQDIILFASQSTADGHWDNMGAFRQSLCVQVRVRDGMCHRIRGRDTEAAILTAIGIRVQEAWDAARPPSAPPAMAKGRLDGVTVDLGTAAASLADLSDRERAAALVHYFDLLDTAGFGALLVAAGVK